MNMVTAIRHEVGKMAVQRMFYILCIMCIVYMVIAFLVLGTSVGEVLLYGGGLWAFFLLNTYLLGYFNRKHVVHYVKMVAEEQRQVQLACAKGLKEWTEMLALLDHDPWKVYDRIMQGEKNEIQDQHEASAGDSRLDYELSRRMHEVQKNLGLRHKAKKHNLVIPVEDVVWLKESFNVAIEGNKKFASESKKTLDEAEAFLRTLS